MPHVVTGRCVDCRYTDCCTVCPVDCFYEVQNPRMLVIDPDTCIDCQLCVPECPINAIFEEDELPEHHREWSARNRELFAAGKQVNTKAEPLPGAKTLDVIQAAEKANGWVVTEPRNS